MAGAGDRLTVGAIFCLLRDLAVERGDHAGAAQLNGLAIVEAGKVDDELWLGRELEPVYESGWGEEWSPKSDGMAG